MSLGPEPASSAASPVGGVDALSDVWLAGRSGPLQLGRLGRRGACTAVDEGVEARAGEGASTVTAGGISAVIGSPPLAMLFILPSLLSIRAAPTLCRRLLRSMNTTESTADAALPDLYRVCLRIPARPDTPRAGVGLPPTLGPSSVFRDRWNRRGSMDATAAGASVASSSAFWEVVALAVAAASSLGLFFPPLGLA